MSEDKITEVLIHVLGGIGSGRTTFKRRFLFDIFDNTYDPTCLVGPERKLIEIAERRLLIGLETSQLYRFESEVDSCIRPADAIILIMAPARPAAMDETVRLRLEVLNAAIEAKGGLIERVVIMKDIDVAWGVDVPGHGNPDLEPDDIDSKERERREQEWAKGAERGHELAKRLGARVSIACPRTGEGVEHVVHNLVLEVLEARKVLAETSKRLEEEGRQKEQERLKGEEKLHTSRLKRLLGKFKQEG